MKENVRLLTDVAEQLRSDPSIDDSRIAIAVCTGIVMLSGSVPSYWQKIEAENTAKRIADVRAVANELQVEIPSMHVRDDVDIAEAAAQALGWHSDLPDSVVATVRNGWISLSGTVDWQYQRDEAELSVRDLRGVKGVVNTIVLRTKPSISNITERIKRELQRTIEHEADRISIETSEGRVTVRGVVHSWFEEAAVRRAAWSVPGVTSVEDHLLVENV